jgi:hypothetical protein
MDSQVHSVAAVLDLQVHFCFRILALRPDRTGRCGRHQYQCRAYTGKRSEEHADDRAA